MKKTFLFIIVSVLIGIGVGILYLQFLPELPPQLVSPLAEVSGKRPTKILGFLPYWLLDKASPSYAGTVTTLAYFSLSISADGSIQKMINPQEEEPGWTTLKKQIIIDRLNQAHLAGQTTSLVIFSGDQNTLNALFSDPISHATTLLNDVIPLMRQYKFDDLNLDLESLGEASIAAEQQVTEFVQTVKDGLVANKLGTLSIDMIVSSLFQQQKIHPVDIGKIVDTVIIMTYDYHYPGSLLAGSVAPLGGSGVERVYDVTSTINKISQLVPREKILMGIPLYGYEWETIASAPGSPVIPGSGQTASDRRVEQLLSTCTNCIHNTDSASQESYIIFPDESHYHQIFYSDPATIAKRIDLARSSSIGGVALWALGYEGSETLQSLEQYKKSLVILGK